jgi:hypothetical protein
LISFYLHVDALKVGMELWDVTAAALYTTGTAKKKKKSGWGGSSTER